MKLNQNESVFQNTSFVYYFLKILLTTKESKFPKIPIGRTNQKYHLLMASPEKMNMMCLIW